MQRRRGLLPALVAVALAASACSDGADSGDTTSASAAPDTSVAVSTTSAASTTTAGPPATDVPATDPPATDAPTTDAPTTTAPPATLPADLAAVTPVVELPPQPEGVPFPTQEWPEGDLPADVDAAALDAATQAAFKAGTDDPGHVKSIVIVQGGRIVYEAYHPLSDVDTVHSSFSVAKSVTSAGLGILIGEGLVPLTGPAPVAAWSDPADPRHEITVEDLLNMASGLQWLEVYGPGSEPLTMLSSPDASDYVASLPLVTDPGTAFNYSTGTTAVLAQILTDAAWAQAQGTEVDPAAEPDPAAGIDFMEDRLFDPIGITSDSLMRDPEGTWLGGVGADMTTRDFARFGLLFLRDGVWDGERILPENWVQYSWTPSAASAGYGAQWWLYPEDGTYMARGLFGQIVAVVPELDLVVAINSEQNGDSDGLVEAAIDAFRVD